MALSLVSNSASRSDGNTIAPASIARSADTLSPPKRSEAGSERQAAVDAAEGPEAANRWAAACVTGVLAPNTHRVLQTC
jgi:hypothetical protein